MRKSKLKFLSFLLCASILFYNLCFGASHSLYAQEASKEDESLFLAKKAFEDGFYEVSLGMLERFLKNYPASPKHAEVNLLIGECYFHQNRFLEALNKFEGLLSKPSSNNLKDAIFYWIAEVQFKGNNFDKAAEYYKKIIDEFPNSVYAPNAYYSLGWCLFQSQKFNDALKFFKVIEEKYSKEPQAKEASFKIIECLYNLKDYNALKDKLKQYLKVYAKDPGRLTYLYFYLAEADYYLNNFSEAIDGYSKASINTKDDKLEALAKLGMAWSSLKLKRYKEAENAFNDIKPANLEKRSLDVLLLGKAILLTETSRIDESRRVYDELLLITQDPVVMTQAYLGKADTLYNLSDYSKAVDVYKEAIAKVNGQDVPQDLIDKLHYGLAWSFLKEGEFKEAIKEFRMIAKESEDKVVKVSALCQIGDAYQDSGDYAKAQEVYDSILKDYSDNFYSDYVQYQLGLTFLKASNYDGAILSFLNFKKNFSQSKLLDEATYALGLAYFQKQDYNSSREIFEKFQDQFKESNLKSDALYLLGTSLYNLGKYTESIEVFKNIVRLYGQNPELIQKAEYEIADCFYQMGNEKEAMERFKSLRSKYPDSSLTAEIIWWLGEYYYRHNDFMLARRYFNSLIKDFPRSSLISDAYYALGSTYIEDSKYDEAIKNFKKAVELGKPDLAAQSTIAIADCFVKKGSLDQALGEYKDVIKKFPNFSSVIYPKLAELYFNMNNYDEALNYYRNSLDIVPEKEMGVIQFKIAEVLESKGKPNEAVEEYLKATYLYPGNNSLAIKAYLRVSSIYENRENYKEAQNIYKKIVAMGVPESKYAQERLDWIKANIKK
ncbi:MAG: tetratricopeptide repeat protein [Candidatus Omnitrophica bacterium]|nr:tetratricopeptide repeat protein [Candidatus Omnitrophota bacterium]